MFEIHKELFGDLKKQRRKIHKNIRKSEKRFKEDFENISISFIRNYAKAQRKKGYLGATCSYIYDNPEVRDTYYKERNKILRKNYYNPKSC